MGTTSSALETPLGKSLIGKYYETNIPVSWNGTGISLWKDEDPDPMNPNIGDYEIKLPAGIRFKIINIEKTTNFEIGTSVNITIKILHNVPINNVLPMYIAVFYTTIDGNRDGRELARETRTTINYEG